MIYIKNLSLPPASAEQSHLSDALEVKMTCFNNFYPFGVFQYRFNESIELSHITIFCGDNGSGKSTLLNLIADKLELERTTIYNKSTLYDTYLDMVHIEESLNYNKGIYKNSKIITSDDVFDYLFNMRYMNENIDINRSELMEEYVVLKNTKFQFTSLDDYDEMKKVMSAKMKTKSKYVKGNVMKNVVGKSNGESALMYFQGNIAENGIYLLDEPENSLSPKNQIKLLKYIEDSVRFYNSQVIISTHSPFLLSLKDALIYDLDRKPVRVVDYNEIENVRLYYNFFKENEDRFNV